MQYRNSAIALAIVTAIAVSCVRSVRAHAPLDVQEITLRSCIGCRAQIYQVDGTEHVFLIVSRQADLQTAQKEMCDRQHRVCVVDWTGVAEIVQRLPPTTAAPSKEK